MARTVPATPSWTNQTKGRIRCAVASLSVDPLQSQKAKASQRPGPWWSLSTIKNRKTDNPLNNPLVLVKTVRDRFESTMKLVKEMTAAVPFHSSCNDTEAPNNMLVVLEDLISFEEDQSRAS
jgi:hypothetical protein